MSELLDGKPIPVRLTKTSRKRLVEQAKNESRKPAALARLLIEEGLHRRSETEAAA